MQWRTDDDGVADAPVNQKRERARRILGSGRGGGLQHELDRGSLPEREHLFRFRDASVRRPAAEHNDLWSMCLGKLRRVADISAAASADRIVAGPVASAAPEDDKRERLHPRSVRIGPIG